MKYSRLYQWTRVGIALVSLGPLRVGGGRGYDIEEPDLPVIRNASGNPIIPGSSLKGVTRSAISRVTGLPWDELVYLFGSSGKGEGEEEGETKGDKFASPLIFSDAVAEVKSTKERIHIRINPKTGGVQNLFEVEFVPENTSFKGEIMGRNLPVSTLAGVVYLLKSLMDLDLARIGGFKTRGYGRVKMDVSGVTHFQTREKVEYETQLGTLRGRSRKVGCEVLKQGNLTALKVTEEGKELKQVKVETYDPGLILSFKLNVEDFLELGRTVAEEWLR